MNQTIRRQDLDELKHYGVKGMKWTEKNQKALPSSHPTVKIRDAIREEFNTKPRTKLEEANAREKLKNGQVSPDLFGLSKSEIRQYYALDLEDRKKFDAVMVEKAKKGAFINGHEVFDQFKKEIYKNDPRVLAREKEKHDNYLSTKAMKKLEAFTSNLFKETFSFATTKSKK